MYLYKLYRSSRLDLFVTKVYEDNPHLLTKLLDNEETRSMTVKLYTDNCHKLPDEIKSSILSHKKFIVDMPITGIITDELLDKVPPGMEYVISPYTTPAIFKRFMNVHFPNDSSEDYDNIEIEYAMYQVCNYPDSTCNTLREYLSKHKHFMYKNVNKVETPRVSNGVITFKTYSIVDNDVKVDYATINLTCMNFDGSTLEELMNLLLEYI